MADADEVGTPDAPRRHMRSADRVISHAERVALGAGRPCNSAALTFFVSIVLVALFACGPGRPALTPSGAQVEARPYPPNGKCEPVGDVRGTAGDSWRPFSDDQLVDYATNDLRNAASVLGATYVQYGTPDFRRRLDHTSVTVSGEAFRCSTH